MMDSLDYSLLELQRAFGTPKQEAPTERFRSILADQHFYQINVELALWVFGVDHPHILTEEVVSGGPSDTVAWFPRPSLIPPVYSDAELRLFISQKMCDQLSLDECLFQFARQVTLMRLWCCGHEFQNSEMLVDIATMFFGFAEHRAKSWCSCYNEPDFEPIAPFDLVGLRKKQARSKHCLTGEDLHEVTRRIKKYRLNG